MVTHTHTHTYTHTHIHTYTHTYTHDNYYNPRCAHAHRGLIIAIADDLIEPYPVHVVPVVIIFCVPMIANPGKIRNSQLLAARKHFPSYGIYILGLVCYKHTIHIYRQTHTRDNYRNPRCACAPRVNKL